MATYRRDFLIHNVFTYHESYDAIIIFNMVAQDPNDLNIPVLHHNKQIHVLLFILICVIVAGSVVFWQIKRSDPPESMTANQLAELTAAKQEEVAQSLTVQTQSPQLKAKFEEVMKSLNQKK